MIAESDLNSLMETVYLFRWRSLSERESPANTRRLLDSLDEYRSGKIRDLDV